VVTPAWHQVSRTTVFKAGDKIITGGYGRVMFKAASGVVAEIPPGSEVVLQEKTSEWQKGELRKSKTLLEAKKGDAYVAVEKDLGDKVVAEVRTPKGIAKAAGQPEAKK